MIVSPGKSHLDRGAALASCTYSSHSAIMGCFTLWRIQPNVNAYAPTPESRNSISNRRSATGVG
jgi:hypothetical protein